MRAFAYLKPRRGERTDWQTWLGVQPVGSWWLNECASRMAWDTSGNHYDGVLTTSSTLYPVWTPGPSGSTLDFSRDTTNYQRVVIPRAVISTALAQFSLVIRFKMDSVSGTTNFLWCAEQTTTAATGRHSTLAIDTDEKLGFIVGNGTSANSAVQSSVLVAGRWYTAACTYVSGSIKLYLDGVLQGTATTVTGNLYYPTSVDCSLGCRIAVAPAFPADVTMCCCHVFNRTLTADQVAAYQRPVPLMGRRYHFYGVAAAAAPPVTPAGYISRPMLKTNTLGTDLLRGVA